MQFVFAVIILLGALSATVCMVSSTRPDPKMDLLLRLIGEPDDAASKTGSGSEK